MFQSLFQKISHPALSEQNNKGYIHGGFFISLNRKVMIPRKGKPAFIVFEGLDGSGQSTQAGLIRDHLEKNGIDVLITKEPTILTDAGKRVFQALNQEIKISSQELQQLCADDRKIHLEKVILPALQEGRTVLCDRYFFSSFAYGSLDCKLDWLMRLNGDFIFPDVIFVLLTNPAICMERIKNKGERIQIFEEQPKLNKVYEMYRRLARMFDDIYLINGDNSIEEAYCAILVKLPDFLFQQAKAPSVAR